jgi:MoaA/NifB/PqqE/SkfB family radical SAM enzyme
MFDDRFLLERHFVRHAACHLIGRASLYYPLCGYVYLTYRCNLACSYCDDGTGVKYPDKAIDRELTTEQWKDLFRILRHETDVLILTGGEPTCRTDLVELLRFLQQLRYRWICVLTNALTLDQFPDVLALVDMLYVKLDTLDLDQGDRLLGRPGAQQRILSNVAWAAEHGPPRGCRVCLGCCVTSDTIAAAGRVLDFAVEHNLGFSPMPAICGVYPDPGLKGNPEYEALIQRAIDLKRAGFDVPGSMPYLRGLQRFRKFRCQPTLLARIRPNGEVLYPCGRIGTAGGNILTLGSLPRALDEGVRRHGPIPNCDNRCHFGCYMDFSLLVQHPWTLLYEAYLELKRRARRRRVRKTARDGKSTRGSMR